MLYHTISPLYDEKSKILILGSFPSPKSREQKFFYGHPRNRMWQVLSKVFDQNVPSTVAEKRDFLLQNHIAMWDVLFSCDIKGADDSSISNETPNDLSNIIKVAKIKAIFTTGTKAAKYYEKYNANKINIPYYKLPSTSPANAKMQLDELISKYMFIKQFV